jgi:hypothetical protein
MKKINQLIYMLSAVLIAGFTGCSDRESEGLSRQTDYPEFTMLGDIEIIHQLGTPFVDPGVTASEAGVALTVSNSPVGQHRGGKTLDENMSDWYNITYSATNKDGFSGSVSRDVYVANNGDLTKSLEGIYTCNVKRNGTISAPYKNIQYILIWKNTDGTYQISDGVGGYYHYGRGYGVGYAAPGAKITVNDMATNDFSYSAFNAGTFGGAVDMHDMVVDPVAKKITWVADWVPGATAYKFEVELTQVPF